MIVDSMTYEEILQELKREEASVFAKSKLQLQKDYDSKYIRSFHSLPIIYTREITSNNNNLYIALYYLNGKRNGKGTISITEMEHYKCAVHFREGKGYYAYFWSPSMPHMLMEYIPHFFTRYAERMGLKGNPIDIMKQYLKRNRKTMGSVAVYKNKFYTAAVMEDGISLGVFEGFVTKCLTFVSYDMLFDNQKDWHDSMKVNLRSSMLLKSGTLEPKERRRVWREYVENNITNDEAFKEFWRLFALRHLKKKVNIERTYLSEENRVEIILMTDVEEPSPQQEEAKE